MKKLIIIGTILIILAALFLGVVHPMFKEYERVAQLSINEIDLSKVIDGTYTGSFVYVRRNIVVEVEVQNHSITSVEFIERDNAKYTTRAAKQLSEQIIKKQNNCIDAVSGATTSSKALLKAIENALLQETETTGVVL